MFSERVIEEIKNLPDMKLVDLAQECNSWNRDCYWLDVFPNDKEGFDILFNGDVEEAIRACYYGGDDYNYTDDWVKLDAYGNLKSFNEYSLGKEARDTVDYIISALENNPHAESLLNDLGIYLDDEE